MLIRILADGFVSGALTGESALCIGAPAGGPGALAAASPARRPQAAGIAARLADAVRADLNRARGDIAPELPDELMLAGITAWVQLFGMVRRVQEQAVDSGQFCLAKSFARCVPYGGQSNS